MAIGDAKMPDAPSCAFQIGTIRAPIPSLVFGKARARRAATVAASAFAWEMLTPGLSLTMAWKFRASRSAFAGQWHWYPAVQRDSRKIAVKFRRRHADDGDLVPVNAYGAAENGRVAPEIVLPQPVADDRRERFGPVAVFRRERTCGPGMALRPGRRNSFRRPVRTTRNRRSLRRRSRREHFGSAAIRRCFGGCPGSPGSRHRKH